MNFLDLPDGARLAFSDTGAGLPVVFLPPTPFDHDYWRLLVGRLPGIRSIALDLRGHGASTLGMDLAMGAFTRVPDAPAMTMARLAADVLAVLDHLGVKQAVFAGCSVGGSVVLELWRRAPERMRGLAIVCSKPQPEGEAVLAKRVTTIAQARTGDLNAMFDGMVQSLTGAEVRQAHPERVKELRAQMKISREALVAMQAGLALRPDSVPTVRTITVPMLAIVGGQDPSTSREEMEAFKAAPGGCSLHLLPDAGHLAAYEQPDEVAELFEGWLRQFGVA